MLNLGSEKLLFLFMNPKFSAYPRFNMDCNVSMTHTRALH